MDYYLIEIRLHVLKTLKIKNYGMYKSVESKNLESNSDEIYETIKFMDHIRHSNTKPYIPTVYSGIIRLSQKKKKNQTIQPKDP